MAEQYVLEPRHYLPLLRRKPGALHNGRPFQGEPFGPDFALLRRELEYRYAADGTKQFLRVLLLLTEHPEADVCAAVAQCVALRAFHADAIENTLRNAPLDLPPSRLDLSDHPELAHVGNGIRLAADDDVLFESQRDSDADSDSDAQASRRASAPGQEPVVHFAAVPQLNKRRVLDLARGEFLSEKANVILLGAPGVGKTHVAIGLAREACRRGHRVRFFTASGLVHEYLEAREERRILRLEASIARTDLIVVDELGYLPLDKTGAEHLFGFFSRCDEQCSLIVTTNLPFADWPNTFAGDARLAGALIDRLTHRIHVIEMCGESYRLRQSLLPTSSPIKNEPTKTKPSDVKAKSSSETPEPSASRRDSQERPE